MAAASGHLGSNPGNDALTGVLISLPGAKPDDTGIGTAAPPPADDWAGRTATSTQNQTGVTETDSDIACAGDSAESERAAKESDDRGRNHGTVDTPAATSGEEESTHYSALCSLVDDLAELVADLIIENRLTTKEADPEDGNSDLL